jgi:hypothetical protein
VTVRTTLAPVHEAFTVPLLLVACILGGGFRTGAGDGRLLFSGPPLMSLVLAVLLLGVLARSGVLVPWLLVGPHRRPIENLSGATIVVLLLLASAQVFHCLTPETGVLNVLANVFFVVLLLNTLASRPHGTRVLQSLGVVFLSAFVLKYVVLDALYAPEGSLARRLVTTLLEGVSLGALGHTPHGRATGYAAFATVLTYLFTLVLLPQRVRTWLAVEPASDESLARQDPDDR